MIEVSRPDIGVREINAAVRVLQSGRLSDGPQTANFQSDFKRFVDTQYCSMVSNGTFAIESVLRAYGISKGDEVIVPPLTFFATIEAVMAVGAKPVFADIDPDTWNVTEVTLEEQVTPKTKAVIPVHIFGNPCKMLEIIRWIQYPPHKLKVIEDCCQAHGSTIDGVSVGKSNGCWSFFATKNMTTGGEGGAVTTNDPDVYSFVSKYKNHGMVSRDEHIMLGTNGRMSEVEAAIGRVQLTRLKDMNYQRKQQVEVIKEGLKNISWLKPQKIEVGHESSYFWNAFWVDEEKLGYKTSKLIYFLQNFAGIEVRHRYFDPLYRQPVIRDFETKLPNAEKICGKVIGLPLGYHLSSDNLDYIIDTIKKI